VAAIYTIDASVMVNAFNVAEPGHEYSYSLLDRLRRAAVPIAVPTLLLPEVAATIARVRRDTRLAREFAAEVARLPNVLLVSLDPTLGTRAADVAAEYFLRGADAVYVAVALRFGSVLVTLDQQQRERAQDVVPAQSPAEALAELSGT
jgi:predicted nucleic acid-binding protein